MPNATAHRMTAALTIGAASFHAENKREGENTAAPLAHAALAWCMGTLPDVIEPACHPNHRRFFHSFAFAVVIGYGMYKLYQWDAETDGQRLTKTVGLVAAGAYLVHLVMDATTAKSLPVV